MRRTTAVLALCLGLLAPLAGAGAASADVPINQLDNYSAWTNSTGGVSDCMTNGSYGVPYQYGAWGDYVDGCTSPRAVCPSYNPRYCAITAGSSFGSQPGPRIYRVTQNARLRVYAGPSSSTLLWFRDSSCSGTASSCGTRYYAYIAPGQSATTQCNGVREHVASNPSPQHNDCWVEITF